MIVTTTRARGSAPSNARRRIGGARSPDVGPSARLGALLAGIVVAGGCGGEASPSRASTAAAVSSGAVMSLPEPRAGHTAVLLASGEVFVAGGVDASGRPLDTTALIGGGHVRSGPRLSVARSGHSATLLPSGEVLIAGGFSHAASTTPLDSTEVYDPVTETTTPGPRLVTARAHHVALDLGGAAGSLVLLAGGVTDASRPGKVTGDAEVLDVSGGSSGALPGGLVQARSRAQVVRLPGGDLLVVSGEGAAGAPGAEVFDVAARRFSAVSLGVSRAGAAVVGHGPEVLVAGGEGQAGLTGEAEVFDAVAGAFVRGPRLTAARRDATAVEVGGAVVVIGGRDGAGAVDTV